MPTKIEISHKTIFFTAAFLATIWLIIQIWDILALLFVAFILMAGLRPLVDRLERLGIPRVLSILTLYIVLFGVIGGTGSLLLPPIITETTRFIGQLSLYIEKILPFLQVNLQSIIPQIGPFGQNVARLTFGVFTNVITIFTLFIFTFYLLLERKNLGLFLREAVGSDTALLLIRLILRIEDQLGGWIRGQLLLMTIIGIVVYIGLTLLHVPFALPLAVIAGLLEVVPNIGPTISALPSIIVVLATTGNILFAISVAALYFIVQQLENTLIVPFVMKRVVGLPPLLTMSALLIGGRLAGVVGILFAVPFVLISKTIIQELIIKKKR